MRYYYGEYNIILNMSILIVLNISNTIKIEFICNDFKFRYLSISRVKP